MVRRRSACLIDVYETAIQVDEARYTTALAERAGVSLRELEDAVRPALAAVTVGRLTLRSTLVAALNSLGIAPDLAWLEAYGAASHRALRESVTLPDDTVPFLTELRSRGVRTAILSNCADNTRPLLRQLGLIELVDEVVLSCEVGLAKPDPGIFQLALTTLGADPADTLFVDDQPRFCDAAALLGIESVVLDRSAGQTLTPLLDRL